MCLRKSFALVICALSFAVCGLAQSTPVEPSDKPNVFFTKEPKVDKSRLRDLKGVVKDESDQPVDAAIVQLTNLKTGKVVDFRTKLDGKYLFYDLNMDQDYELRVLREGFTTSDPKKLTRYDTRKPAVLNFEIDRKKAA